MMVDNKAVKGLKNEIDFVKNFNKYSDKSLLRKMEISENDVLAVHLNSMIYSEYHKKKIYPKSDICLVKNLLNKDLLITEDFYLSDNSKLLNDNFNDLYIPNSGISIKLKTNKYTIHKMGPTFFNNVFKNSELGAGSSIYCMKIEEINKNEQIYEAWGTSEEEVKSYFNTIFQQTLNLKKLDDLKRIKSFSNERIKALIKGDDLISDLIFKGKYCDDPYSANWIYDQKGFRKIDTTEEFKITTGSGRSRGDYTIVIKP